MAQEMRISNFVDDKGTLGNETLIGGGGGGGGGESTIAWKPTVAADGTISWLRTSSTTKPADQNIKGADGADGVDGQDGADGFSPTVTITPIQGGNRVTIKDADGDHEFDVMDGSGGIKVVPSDDRFTANDPDGLNSATLSVGGAGVLFDISGSQVAELPNKAYVDDRTALPTTEVYNADSTASDFNPVATEYVKDGGVTYTKYRFYYRTSFLAAADATKTFDFSTLMANYTVKEWTNVSGFTDNGHKLSSGRTDNVGNVAILQQLGRNSKQLIIRSYGDLSSHAAILQLEFYGTKN